MILVQLMVKTGFMYKFQYKSCKIFERLKYHSDFGSQFQLLFVT